MRNFVLQRAGLPMAMLALLLLSLAYWWLDNAPHELFGTALFALLSWHVYLNRVWFRNLTRGTYDVRRIFVVLLHAALIVNMALLLITSGMISETVFAWVPGPDSNDLREIHRFSGYWIVLATGTHVGLHWERVRAGLFSRLSLAGSRVATIAAYALAIVALCQGVASFQNLGVWTKLTFNYSLEFWDFTSSVAPFFGNWIMVFMLPAIVTHVLMKGWRCLRKTRRPRAGDLRSNSGLAMPDA